MSNLLHDRHFKGIFDTELILEHVCVASAKNSVFRITGATHVVGHVLDDAYSWNFQLVEHLDSFYYIDEGKFLGGSHDYGGLQA